MVKIFGCSGGSRAKKHFKKHFTSLLGTAGSVGADWACFDVLLVAVFPLLGQNPRKKAVKPCFFLSILCCSASAAAFSISRYAGPVV